MLPVAPAERAAPAESTAALLSVGDPSRPALLTSDGAVRSHGWLRAAVASLASRLPDVADGRLLVHLPLGRDLQSVLSYLATLHAGHVALVTAGGEAGDRIVARYQPDVEATGDVEHPFAREPGGPRHLLHPDLALLLSTSGSTGSPKLVRLSHRNLVSNAAAIAESLGITAADRAVTSLPLHYTFGLSVLHSHLIAGASVLLHEGSVLDAALWRAVDDSQVTSLAVVPHMVELMESTGVLEQPHPSLRLIAQAGGRMSPERVLRTAATGRAGGWGLAVMYGQTEATARICVLDPGAAARNPDSVGRPVPGISLRLDTAVPEASGGAGEVIVQGPGVMLGYAEHPDDLALGAMLAELRTGDLGRIGDDGLLRLVGRRSGFLKIMGVRIDVASVEDALEAAGHRACVGGDAAGLTVAVEPRGARDAPSVLEEVRHLVGRASGLGPAAVAVAVADLPRLSSGKLDRTASQVLVRRQAAASETASAAAPRVAAVAAAAATALGVDAVDLERSFVEQGGDSLSHVQAALRLERVVGALPRGWHQRPLGELAELAERRAHAPGVDDASVPALARRPRASGLRAPRSWRRVETSVVLRALAVVAICGSHAGLFDILGGAHILLAVAGFNTARFAFEAPSAAGRWRATTRLLIGIAVPTMLLALFGMLAADRYGWSNVLMIHWLVGDTSVISTRNEYWFIDALIAGVIVMAALLTIPAVARSWQRDRWRAAAWFTAAALVPRFMVVQLPEGSAATGIMPTTLWLMGVGAAAAHADTPRRRWATAVLALVGGATFFPDDPVRSATMVAGLAALILVAHLRVPAWSVPVLGLLAAASLYIYLVQFMVLSLLSDDLLETLAALVAGCLLWLVLDRPVRRLQDLVPLPDGSPRPARRLVHVAGGVRGRLPWIP